MWFTLLLLLIKSKLQFRKKFFYPFYGFHTHFIFSCESPFDFSNLFPDCNTVAKTINKTKVGIRSTLYLGNSIDSSHIKRTRQAQIKYCKLFSECVAHVWSNYILILQYKLSCVVKETEFHKYTQIIQSCICRKSMENPIRPYEMSKKTWFLGSHTIQQTWGYLSSNDWTWVPLHTGSLIVGWGWLEIIFLLMGEILLFFETLAFLVSCLPY